MFASEARAVVNLEDLRGTLVPSPVAGVRRSPTDPQGEMWYGEILRQLPDDTVTSRDHNVPFAVVFHGAEVVRAWCDVNLNGDLTDDPQPVLSSSPGRESSRSFLCGSQVEPASGTPRSPMKWLVRVVIEPPDSVDSRRRYRTQDVNGMLGSASVDGKQRLVRLHDANHERLYTKGRSGGIFFDLDGDRHFAIDVMAPDFGPLAIPFTLGRTTYAADSVASDGSALILRTVGLAPRVADPEVGRPAPGFGYSASDGRG